MSLKRSNEVPIIPQPAKKTKNCRTTPLQHLDLDGGVLDEAVLSRVAAICQQNNCVGTGGGRGLAAGVSKKLPYGCPYKDRRRQPKSKFNVAALEDRAVPGTIDVRKPPAALERPMVICMFGQFEIGGPDKYKRVKPMPPSDGASAREAWFAACLEQIGRIQPPLPSIAFPHQIGCGLAGGNWQRYLSMIRQFSEAHPSIEVIVARWTGGGGRGGRGAMMPASEFREMKSDLSTLGREAVIETCAMYCNSFIDSQAWSRWCLSASGPPPDSLSAWDDALGRSNIFKAPPPNGSGFRGELVFAEGDMITLAAESAASGVSTAVLNMANSHTPGGGFLKGCRAQEEQLCHRSDLFLRLQVAKARGDYPLSNGVALFTPCVSLLRGDSASHFQPLVNPVNLNVVSAAARMYKNEEAALKDKALSRELEATWRGVLEAAGKSGVEHLVLSAIGAGAFSNPPEVVAKALTASLRACSPGEALRRVTVCVLDDHNSRDNVARFREVMVRFGARVL